MHGHDFVLKSAGNNNDDDDDDAKRKEKSISETFFSPMSVVSHRKDTLPFNSHLNQQNNVISNQKMTDAVEAFYG